MIMKKREMKYKYFIVYEGRKGKYESITGNVEMTSDEEIKRIDQIKELEENLKENIEGANAIVITNYKLLDTIKEECVNIAYCNFKAAAISEIMECNRECWDRTPRGCKCCIYYSLKLVSKKNYDKGIYNEIIIQD